MRYSSLLPMLLASSLAVLAACGDDVTDPAGFAESAEAEAIMRSAAALPLLPQYLTAADGVEPAERAVLQRARELWDAGTASADTRAAARRRLAVDYALPVLVDVVPEEEWVESRERLDEWLQTASTMLRHLELPAVEVRVRAAARHLSRADAAPSDRTRAYHLLLAGSELVETTPRYVARAMARDAEEAVRGAAASADPPPPSTLKRAERLRDWSVRAVEDGDYLLAIHRGYYAIQLVEER